MRLEIGNNIKKRVGNIGLLCAFLTASTVSCESDQKVTVRVIEEFGNAQSLAQQGYIPPVYGEGIFPNYSLDVLAPDGRRVLLDVGAKDPFGLSNGKSLYGLADSVSVGTQLIIPSKHLKNGHFAIDVYEIEIVP